MQTVIKNPNWWRRRTHLERCLTLTTILATIVVVALVAALLVVLLWTGTAPAPDEMMPSTNQTMALHGTHARAPLCVAPATATNSIDGVCMTPQCVHSASEIIKKMDTEVEPCDDFYRFACGTYLRTEPIPDDKVSVNTFSKISIELQLKLKNILMEAQPTTLPHHYRLPYLLYEACMNESLIEERDTAPIGNIAKMLGGWPVLAGDKWNGSGWTWDRTVRHFRKVGFSTDYIMDFSVNIDYKNSTHRIIDFDQPGLGMSREYLIKGQKDDLVTAYYEYMVDLAVLYGADETRAEKELHETLEFEIQLANISLPMEERRDPNKLYNLMTLAELQKRYPQLEWVDYVNALLLSNEVQVNETEVVNLSVPTFFDRLFPLLAKTPSRVVANYMMWRIYAYAVTFMPERFRKRQLQYAKVLYGKQEQEARWKECVDLTSGSLGIAVGSLYVRKHFNEDAKAAALKMVNAIKDVFRTQILNTIEWMDADTREAANEKLQRMTTHIGYPSEMIDDAKLAEFYSSIHLAPHLYLESFLNITTAATNRSFGRLRQMVNKTEWIRHAMPAVVNAFYSSIENSIQFPAGILQGHFFNADRPLYMNYGAIGYVIGHEITHGFDDQGRRFNADGNLIDWWAGDTEKKYLEKAQCIIEQYGNYTDEQTGKQLNGINTQGENIADNGGIKESYIAYKMATADLAKPEPQLPGLQYSPEQMFWIAAAQTWCAKYRSESLKNRITTGVHSPSEFRVLGSFSNMKNFTEDFNCPKGSKMNPWKKCEVW